MKIFEFSKRLIDVQTKVLLVLYDYSRIKLVFQTICSVFGFAEREFFVFFFLM